MKFDSTQEHILSSDLSQNWLITGGPGTGKTILANKMAERLSNAGKKVLVCMYNRPLMKFVTQKMQEIGVNQNYDVYTYFKFFNEVYRTELGFSCPELTDEYGQKKILLDMRKVGKLYDTVIVDEAQDFPQVLVQALMEISDNIICFFNQNQSITEAGVSAENLVKMGCKAMKIHLDVNYRTTREINKAAQIFTNDKEYVYGIQRGEFPQVYECEITYNRFEPHIKRMDAIIRQNPNKTIGIIMNYNSLTPTFDELLVIANGDYSVQLFKSGAHDDLDFTVPGAKILSYGTMKGLEFDIVILPYFDRVRSTGDQYKDRNRLYVAFTRAKEKLFLLYSDDWNYEKKWMNTVPVIKENNVYFDWH